MNFLRVFLMLIWSLLVTPAAETQFAVYDIVIDPKGEPLAAYQVKIQGPPGVKFVGVEGGEHPAFAEPPVYDGKALRNETIILAAVSAAKNLPVTKTRVATLHVQISGAKVPELNTKLQSAATSAYKRISPEITIRKRPEDLK